MKASRIAIAAGSGLLALTALAGPVAAAELQGNNFSGNTPSSAEVSPESIERDTTTTVELAFTDEAPAAQNNGTSLPFTGGDVVGLTAIGAGALAIGTVMVRRSRKAEA